MIHPSIRTHRRPPPLPQPRRRTAPRSPASPTPQSDTSLDQLTMTQRIKHSPLRPEARPVSVSTPSSPRRLAGPAKVSVTMLATRPSSSSSSSSSSSTAAASSTSDSCSYSKHLAPQRRGLRQKARDVVSDLGAPPTSRHDAKDGKRTLNFAADVAPMAAALCAPVKI